MGQEQGCAITRFSSPDLVSLRFTIFLLQDDVKSAFSTSEKALALLSKKQKQILLILVAEFIFAQNLSERFCAKQNRFLLFA